MFGTNAFGQAALGEAGTSATPTPAPVVGAGSGAFGDGAFGEYSFGGASTAAPSSGISPAAGSVSFAGYAPSVSQPAGLAPAAAGIVFSGQAPSIGQGGAVSPGTGFFVLSGYAPIFIQGNAAELKPISVAQFRLDFPEFADTVKFTDAQVRRQLVASTGQLNEFMWDSQWGYGIELRAAHFLTIAARNAAAVANGGVGGGVSGLLTSKSVDKVSASYDLKATTYEGAGFWNTTAYGIEFYQMLMMFGAGVVQL